MPRQNEMHTAISSALARPRRIYSLRFCLHCRVYTVQQSLLLRSQPESYRRDDLRESENRLRQVEQQC